MSSLVVITTDNQRSCNYASTCTWLALIAVFGSLALGIGLGYGEKMPAVAISTSTSMSTATTTPNTKPQ